MRAAHRAGGVSRIEISSDDGTITCVLSELAASIGEENPWDKVLTDDADQKRTS
jgi:hypothetical protein